MRTNHNGKMFSNYLALPSMSSKLKILAVALNKRN